MKVFFRSFVFVLYFQTILTISKEAKDWFPQQMNMNYRQRDSIKFSFNSSQLPWNTIPLPDAYALVETRYPLTLFVLHTNHRNISKQNVAESSVLAISMLNISSQKLHSLTLPFDVQYTLKSKVVSIVPLQKEQFFARENDIDRANGLFQLAILNENGLDTIECHFDTLKCILVQKTLFPCRDSVQVLFNEEQDEIFASCGFNGVVIVQNPSVKKRNKLGEKKVEFLDYNKTGYVSNMAVSSDGVFVAMASSNFSRSRNYTLSRSSRIVHGQASVYTFQGPPVRRIDNALVIWQRRLTKQSITKPTIRRSSTNSSKVRQVNTNWHRYWVGGIIDGTRVTALLFDENVTLNSWKLWVASDAMSISWVKQIWLTPDISTWTFGRLGGHVENPGAAVPERAGLPFGYATNFAMIPAKSLFENATVCFSCHRGIACKNSEESLLR